MKENGEMGMLERLVFRDSVREALGLMTGYELLIAAGRAAGMGDQELAELLNIEPAVVSYHMRKARERIAEAIPELRVTLSGRWRNAGKRRPVEEVDVCGLEEAAVMLGVSEETVGMWIQQGKLTSAYMYGKEWWILRQELEAWQEDEGAHGKSDVQSIQSGGNDAGSKQAV